MTPKKDLKLLAFDIGATSGRAMVGNFNGELIEIEEVHRFSNGPVQVNDHLYSDVLRIWSEIIVGFQKAVLQSDNKLACVGLDAWGVDYALLDANDRLLTNPFHYRDPRTSEMLSYAQSKVSCAEIYHQTGNVLIEFNTLFQLLWSAREEGELLNSAKTMLMLPDLFNFWLSGHKVSEFSIASTSQCYNPTKKTWSWDLLNRLDIPAHLFQNVVQPGTTIGKLQPWLAENVSTNQIPVIAPACHDTASAVAAIPSAGKEFMYISSGTWSLIGVELDQPLISEQCLASGLTNEGGVGNRYRLLKITPGMWLLQQCRNEWNRKGKRYDYDDLSALALATPAFGSLILASAKEFNAPGDMVCRIQKFCQDTGQPVPQTEGEIVRCILESLALQYRAVLLSLESLLGRSLDVIHIIGGGSRNRLLNTFTAQATGKHVIAGPVEATVTGNLLVQAMGLGYLTSLDEIRQVVSNSFQLEVFEPSNTDDWDEAFRRYHLLNMYRL